MEIITVNLAHEEAGRNAIVAMQPLIERGMRVFSALIHDGNLIIILLEKNWRFDGS